MRTFFWLPFLFKGGECPEYPGFWIPRPPGSPSLGRGFFSEDRSGDLVMVLASDSPVSVVAVVFMEATLPWPLVLYGLPEASVIDIPLPSLKPGLLMVVLSGSPSGFVGSPPTLLENSVSYNDIMNSTELITMHTIWT